MVKYRVKAPDGRTFVIVAPDGTTEQEAINFSKPRADSWEDGATYKMKPSGKAAGMSAPAAEQPYTAPARKKEPASERNQAADQKLTQINAELESVDAEIAEISNKQGRTRPVLLGGRGEPDIQTDRKYFADLQRYRSDLMRYKRQFEIGETGSTVGALGGALTGAAVGGAAGSVVPVAGTGIGAVIGSVLGAAIGSGAGSLWDVEEARKQRDISEEQAKALAINRGVTSLVIDGAAVLVLGPGGRMLGKVARKSPAFQQLRQVVDQVFDWDALKNVAKTQRTDVTGGKRATEMPQGTAQGVTKEIAPARLAPNREEQIAANQGLLEDIAKTSPSGDTMPSMGAITGKPSRGEILTRKIAPERFKESDTQVAQSAFAIRDRALRSLDAGGALEGQDLGNAVAKVVKSADTTLKRKYGPVYEEARREGGVINLAPVANFLETQIKREAAWKPAEMAELKRLRGLIVKEIEKKDVFGQSTGQVDRIAELDFGAAQDFLSMVKATSRGLLTGNEAPTKAFTGVHGEVLALADDAYVKSLKNVNPDLAKKLMTAREDYRITMGDLYGDTMVAIARRNPEDVGSMLTQKGTVSEIQDVREMLDRAFKVAGKRSRLVVGQQGEMVTKELGKGEVDDLRRRIDAGMTKAFIEKETERLMSLGAKLGDSKFRQTLRELLTGKGAVDKMRGAHILTELDKINGALQLVNPEIMARGAPVGSVIGVGRLGGGTAVHAATGTPVGPTTLGILLVSSLGGKMIANAVATSMTHANTGVLRKMTAALKLMRAAGTSPAAAESVTRMTREILEELDMPQEEQQ
jgi:hypothetical protein